MENLILGWYVLTATGSVEMLVAFASLAWLGSIFSPFFGIAGDRLGHRTLLCATRAVYVLLAATVATLTFTGALAPWHVFVIAALAGLMRPSDLVMRTVLVAQTMPANVLLRALAVSRTTSDTARIAGALAGTGSVALIGMGPAYVVVTALYATAFVLSLGVARAPARSADARRTSAAETLAHLKQAVDYIWHMPEQLAAFGMAFLVNLLAFPFFLGLLPYVAKEVYGVGQTGLGYLAAAFASGALAGSVLVARGHLPLRPARAMLANAAAWFVAILLFGETRSLALGLPLLFASGLLQSFCLVPLSAVMLRSASAEMRGRVMGMRMLAVWGLPIGLLAAGPVIAHVGYAATTLIYGGLGLAATIAIGYRWHRELWLRSAAANVPH